jgi:TPR repeat protein
MDFDEENNQWEAGRNLFRVALCAVEEVKKRFLAAKEKNKEAEETDRTECTRAVNTAVAFVKLGVKGIKLIAIAAIRGNAIAQMDLMDILELEENQAIFLTLLKSLLTQKNMPNGVAYELKLRIEILIKKLIQNLLRDLQCDPKDASVTKIIKVISACADQGYGVAQYILSDMYKEGIGVKKDIDRAIELLELAAKQEGQIYAQIALGRLYHWVGTTQYYDRESKLTFFSKSTNVYEQVAQSAQSKLGAGDVYSLSKMYGYLGNTEVSQYFFDIFQTLEYKRGGGELDLHLKSCQEVLQQAVALVNDRMKEGKEGSSPYIDNGCT